MRLMMGKALKIWRVFIFYDLVLLFIYRLALLATFRPFPVPRPLPTTRASFRSGGIAHFMVFGGRDSPGRKDECANIRAIRSVRRVDGRDLSLHVCWGDCESSQQQASSNGRRPVPVLLSPHSTWRVLRCMAQRNRIMNEELPP